MNSFKKFSENKLPEKCTFFSSLKDQCISGKDYEKAKIIWNVFKMKTLGDYQNLFLKNICSVISRCF